jgi:hypothetical protein
MWELIWFSAVANISITGMNFSLMLNSVGFYQVSFSVYITSNSTVCVCVFIDLFLFFLVIVHSFAPG